jgi:putative peptidoglycan lipid II flippase
VAQPVCYTAASQLECATLSDALPVIEPSNVTPTETAQAPFTLSEDPGIVRAAAVMSIGSVVSRVMGLLREIVKSNMFGTSPLLAAYTVAALVPMTLFNLISGGEMVSSSLVPVFSDFASRERRPELWRLASSFLTLATIVLCIIVILVEFFAPQVAWLAGARNFEDPDLLPVTVNLMRLATPAVLFLSIASILTGVLLSLRRFTLPAFTTAAFNFTIVVVALIRPDKIDSLVWGILFGSILQVLMQAPGLLDGRLRPSLNWKHPALHRIVTLYAPIVVALVVNQIAIWISYNLAIKTGDNSVTYMTYATTLYQFPLGLVVTALSIATLPTLSRLASAYHDAEEQDAPDAADRLNEYRETLAGGLRLVIALGLPAAAGLFALAQPIVALLLQHGEFTAQDTATTALVLRVYLFGLGFAAVDQMLVFASYARKDTWRPALAGVLSISVYTLVAVMLLGVLDLLSLMVADALKHVIHTAIMLALLQRHVGGLAGYRIGSTVLKSLAAAVVSGLAAAATAALAGMVFPGDLFRQRLVIVTIAGAAGLAVYIAAAFALDLKDAKSLWNLLWKRLRA